MWIVIQRGWYGVTRTGWWTNSLQGVLPEQFAGGIYHAMYGTLVQAGVAAVLAVPLGLMAAVYLVEYGAGPLARATTFMVDVLAGVPSIVAALFIFSLWITTLGFQQSAFAVLPGVGLADAAGCGAHIPRKCSNSFPTSCEKPATRWAFRSG